MLERNYKKPADYRARFEQAALGHLGALYGTALRLTHNQRDAEDLVQDSLLSAFRAFDQFVPGSQCKAWLFKILTNTFINKYRRRVLERQVAQSMERSGETGVMSSGGVRAARDAEETLQYSLMSEAIHKALGDLPEEFRLAVVLCDVEEFSYREIADIMECPVGTVMSRLHRGRRLLQVALREEALRCGIVRKEPGEEDELAARRPAVAAGAGGAQVYQLPRRQGSATKKP
jgi:RNA polymerase sigma-70 factor (ECF subfamily)